MVVHGTGFPVELGVWLSLIEIAPCGLPSILGCRQLRRQGYVGVVWAAVAIPAPATVAESLFTGPFGSEAVAVHAAAISPSVWLTGGALGQGGQSVAGSAVLGR